MVINTDADVIRVIRQNPRLIFQAMSEDPELLAEVRRAILTDELLGLPTQFAEMQTDLAETRQIQNAILEELAETRRVQSEMLKNQTRILDRLDRNEKIQNRMSGRLGNLEGAELERKLPRTVLGRICQMYRLRQPRILMSESVLSPHTEGFINELSEANFADAISDEQYNSLVDTDMILRSRGRDDGEITYCAVEASSVIDSRDVARAVSSSVALHAVYGDKAIPLVAGYELTDDARKLAGDKTAGVIIVNRAD